ncbi:KilA domain-containing protein [Azospirillaceae bacterium]
MNNETAVIIREFNAIQIGQRADGYLNATAMCKANGKEWSNYNQIGSAKEFIATLSTSLGITRDALIISVITGPNEERGTWVHPQVAYHLAMWCSPDFAVQVTEWIHDIRNKGYATAPGVIISSKKFQHVDISHVANDFKCLRDFAQEMFGLDKNQATLSANRAVRSLVGVDLMVALGVTHLTAPQQEALLTVTDIGARIGGKSAIAVNGLLQQYGFQIGQRDSKERRYWEPTKKGAPFAIWQDTCKKHSDGTPVRQLKWSTGIVTALKEELASQTEM